MAPPARATSNAAPGPVQIVQRVLNETNPGLLEHGNRVRRFNRAYQVYKGQADSNPKLESWRSRFYVKYGMQVIDQAMVNMVQGTPKAICKPRREQDVEAAKGMEVALGYYGDLDHLSEKESLVAYQALVYGVSPAKNHWLYKEADRRMFMPAMDYETGQPTWKPGNARIVQDDRPSFTPWDAYDVWWDATARDVDCSPYIILRDWLTKEELNNRRYSEDTGIGTYRNLDLLFSTGNRQKPEPNARNELLGTSTDYYKDRFEVWEVWRDDRLTVIGNRTILLFDGPKPYWMPGKPVVIGNTRQEPFQIEGISETELIEDLQKAIWTITNLRMDNVKFTVMRGATYRDSIPNPAQLVMRPAFLWPVTDHDDVKFQDAPPLPAEAYQEEETLLNRLQYVTGITPYVTGASSQSGIDQSTATGVSLLQESASRLLTYKANRVRLQVWQRTYEQWADLTKQFLTREMQVRIEGPGDHVDWQTLGPQSVMGDYDVRIQAGEESLSRQQERAEAIALLNALAPFAQSGQISLQPLLEKVAQAYDFSSAASLFPPPQAPAQQASPLNPQQPPQGSQPFTLGGGLAANPAQSVIRGNAR